MAAFDFDLQTSIRPVIPGSLNDALMHEMRAAPPWLINGLAAAGLRVRSAPNNDNNNSAARTAFAFRSDELGRVTDANLRDVFRWSVDAVLPHDASCGVKCCTWSPRWAPRGRRPWLVMVIEHE